METIGDLTGGSKFTFLTLQRTSVWANVDTESRWFKLDSWQGFRIIKGSNGVTDVGAWNTSHRDDIASKSFINLFLAETTIDEDAVNFTIFSSDFWFTVSKMSFHNFNGLTVLNIATENFTDGIFTKVIIRSE